MKEASCWSIRDGRDTSFWNQPWLDCGVLLSDHLLQDINEEESSTNVAEWVTEEDEWRWGRLKELLPDDILMLIASKITPNPELEDKMIWGLEKDGRFRLKSAYNLVVNINSEGESPRWKAIRQWRGPNRVKHFLWLARHKRLFSNKERTKRKITRDEEELVEHILRSCTKAKLMWGRFKEKIMVKDHNIPFQNWLLSNLKNEKSGVDFGIICWMLIREKKTRSTPSSLKRSQQVGWIPPPEGWVQIQTDGSILSPEEHVAAGGLIRDCEGRCKEAFVCKLGICLITSAELKGTVEGLKIAWNKGYMRVHLNMDSSTAIAIIKNREDDEHRHGHIAHQFHYLLNLDWIVVISHNGGHHHGDEAPSVEEKAASTGPGNRDPEHGGAPP
ncbi:unnamed protein product [Linum tenue]|uniref:RNase H type-1 domain-containing protein n=1 Tax=Linum tenue TaxID=586396 RepID=A0AAV0QRM1_9ROSI|nr:unnamed protein product [Linum tenue]